MILVGRAFGRSVALALLGHDVDQDRPVLRVPHILENRQQVIEIVTVDRADIVKAELLEQRAAGPERAGIFLGALRLLVNRLRQIAGELLAHLAQRPVGAARCEPRQISRHRADRRRDRHVVIVEDDDEAGTHCARIVHGLVGHPGRERTVADHADDVVVFALEVAGDRHAEPGRDRGRCMRGTERVVFALRPLGEARQSAALAQRADAVAPAGQNFVRIGLVADVPYQPVVGRIEHVVQCHRQLDNAEAGTEVAPGDRDGADGFGAQLIRQLPEIAFREPADIRWGFYRVEQGFLQRHGGDRLPVLAGN